MRARHATGITSVRQYSVLLERLYGLGQGRMLPGRDRLRCLLELAGNPQLAVPAVLVGGTNGKGSVVAALSVALSRQQCTGAFLKPHLKTIRERWRIDDQPVSEAAFCRAVEQALELIDAFEQPISFFEANVLIGALAFREAGCEIAVWEVGLGGREDACNLVDPVLSVITSVGLDHMQILGETVAEIALDKAGIARQGRTLLLGPPRPGQEAAYLEYEPVIRQAAAVTGAAYRPLQFLSPDAWDTDPPGGIQPDTLAITAAALGELDGLGLASLPTDLLPVLAGFHYRARLERCTLAGKPALVDAAHNADSIRWLARHLERHFDCRLPLLFGCQATRDPLELLGLLQDSVSLIVPIAVPVLNPCPVPVLAAAAGQLGIPVLLPQGNALATGEPFPLGNNLETDAPDNSTGWIEAVRLGLEQATEEQPLLVCGSIYMIGEVLRAFEDGWAWKLETGV